MALKNRGDILAPGDVIELKVQFKDTSNLPRDLDAFPEIQIVEPTSTIYKDYGSTGVYKIDTGTYGFAFTVPINGPIGVWVDNWRGLMSALTVEGTFNFIVLDQSTDGQFDGYAQLGDAPVYNLSEEAIININRLMHILRRRLQSSGRHVVYDQYGNKLYENCDIFSVDELFSFLEASLNEFNSIPHFTDFTWEWPIVVDQFADVIIEGAYIKALFSKALIEKGREYNITDNGASFTPPAVADMLNNQANSLLAPHRERVKFIKHNLKPAGIGLGTLRMTSVAPQVMRLRHRRERVF